MLDVQPFVLCTTKCVCYFFWFFKVCANDMLVLAIQPFETYKSFLIEWACASQTDGLATFCFLFIFVICSATKYKKGKWSNNKEKREHFNHVQKTRLLFLICKHLFATDAFLIFFISWNLIAKSRIICNYSYCFRIFVIVSIYSLRMMNGFQLNYWRNELSWLFLSVTSFVLLLSAFISLKCIYRSTAMRKIETEM